MSNNKKSRFIQLSAFALVAISGLTLSSGAMAWESWGAWKQKGTTATCSGTTPLGITCTGTASISTNSRTLFATTEHYCGMSAQARGWPTKSNGSYVSVTAHSTGTNGTQTASTSSPHNLTWSQCRCDYVIC